MDANDLSSMSIARTMCILLRARLAATLDAYEQISNQTCLHHGYVDFL